MTDFSPNLEFPFLLPGQAQKHVTLNESLSLLDTVVQLSVVSATEPEPRPESADGDRYLVPQGAAGAFAGQDGQLAWKEQGSWNFSTPRAGWRVWIEDAQRLDVLGAGGWTTVAAEQVNQFGINASPDAVTRLTVSSDAALFSHDGDDHRLKINRASGTDVASVLFQTGLVGTAELGLSGSDGLALRTSADGVAWTTRLDCPDDSAGIRTAALRAGTVSLAKDTVTTISAPEASGILAFWSYNATYPNVNHSAILLFDVGSTPSLVPVFLGDGVSNQGTTMLTGTTGPQSSTNVSVQAGSILLENRRSGASGYRYAFLA